MSEKSNKFISLENFSFSFPSKHLFKKVNLKIPEDSISLLTGANGSGKTTLCRLLSGLQKGYTGKLKITPRLLYLQQSAEKNLLAATPRLDLSLWKNADTTIETVSALAAFNLENKADCPVWELSGGEQQRTILTALLLHKEHFWLLDEPAAGLDNANQSVLLELLKTHKKGALIISHRKELFAPLAQQIYEIENLRIIIKEEK